MMTITVDRRSASPRWLFGYIENSTFALIVVGNMWVEQTVGAGSSAHFNL